MSVLNMGKRSSRNTRRASAKSANSTNDVDKSANSTRTDFTMTNSHDDDAMSTRFDLLNKRVSDQQLVIDELKSEVEKLRSDCFDLRSQAAAVLTDAMPSTRSAAAPTPNVPSLISLNVDGSKCTKEVLARIHCELNEVHKRKQNIIVLGLPCNSAIGDKEQFLDLCETHLSVKPFVTESQCKRLGNIQPGRIQPLRISLTSESAALELIQSSRRFRACDCSVSHKNIYINKDLTPAEAYASYLDRVKRRQNVANNSAKQTAVNSVSLEASTALGLRSVELTATNNSSDFASGTLVGDRHGCSGFSVNTVTEFQPSHSTSSPTSCHYFTKTANSTPATDVPKIAHYSNSLGNLGHRNQDVEVPLSSAPCYYPQFVPFSNVPHYSNQFSCMPPPTNSHHPRSNVYVPSVQCPSTNVSFQGPAHLLQASGFHNTVPIISTPFSPSSLQHYSPSSEVLFRTAVDTTNTAGFCS